MQIKKMFSQYNQMSDYWPQRLQDDCMILQKKSLHSGSTVGSTALHPLVAVL